MKVFVLDTSVLIHDPDAIENFKVNTIVVPIWVVEELDRLKRESGSRGASARRTSRNLSAYQNAGSLESGVTTQNGGTIFVSYCGDDFDGLPVGLERNNDNRVILVALEWKKKDPSHEVVVVSKDMNLRIKANACGIPAQDYEHDKQIANLGDLYTGTAVLEMTDSDGAVLKELYQKKAVAAPLVFSVMSHVPELSANQCCYLQNGNQHAIAIYKKAKNSKELDTFRLAVREDELASSRIKPANAEQWFAYALLTDPAISLVTLAGQAGTGKTLISLLAGNNQLDSKRFRQLLVYRPNVELGRPLGYLPGSLEEKFEPWMQPVFDNFELILGGPQDEDDAAGRKKNTAEKSDFKTRDAINELIEYDLLAIEPINFIQGRTLHKKFVVVDEAQNLKPSDVVALVTRIGEGSKIVLTGDPDQIADSYLDAVSNGLTYIIELMRGQHLYGHITMRKTKRSELAEVVATLSKSK